MGCWEVRGHGFSDSGLQRAEVGRFMKHRAGPEAQGQKQTRLLMFHIEQRSQKLQRPDSDSKFVEENVWCSFVLETISKINAIKCIVYTNSIIYIGGCLTSVHPHWLGIFFEGEIPPLLAQPRSGREVGIVTMNVSVFYLATRV